MDFVPLDIYMLQQMCGALNQNYSALEMSHQQNVAVSNMCNDWLLPFPFFIFTFVNIIVYLYCSSSLVFFFFSVRY